MQYNLPPGTENIAITIRRLKAKILRLTSQYMRGVLLDTTDNDSMQGEDITTYHYIRSRKRQKTQVTQIFDEQGHLQTDHDIIMRQFTNFLEIKYSPPDWYTQFSNDGVLWDAKIPEDANTLLDNPITLEEVREAVKKGKRHKSPGPDGICHEFFIKKWDIVKEDLTYIINNMYMEGSVSDSQKHGHIVYLPKQATPISPENYRPLTILNTDYKLLTRIIANRLRPWMDNILHHNQFCGRTSQTIFDEIANVRDIIAYAEESNKPICLLSTDFNP